jgi:hypothetical protein
MKLVGVFCLRNWRRSARSAANCKGAYIERLTEKATRPSASVLSPMKPLS